jgi:hypothetical protein
MPELTPKTAPLVRPSMLVLRYPLDRIDFRPWARSILAVKRLEDLHRLPDPLPFANYVDRLNHYKHLLTDNFDAVAEQYRALASFVAPLFEGINLRQNVPSFRCHLAGAGSASDFHRDGDPEYRITPGVINGWLPLTDVGGKNSLYIEWEPGSEDYRPVTLQPGEILIFDAYHLKHGSYANDTESTRISFDFRFLPKNPARARELGILATEPGDEQQRARS